MLCNTRKNRRKEKRLKSDLNEIVKRKSEYKSEQQKSAIKNNKTHHEPREKVIKSLMIILKLNLWHIDPFMEKDSKD